MFTASSSAGALAATGGAAAAAAGADGSHKVVDAELGAPFLAQRQMLDSLGSAEPDVLPVDDGAGPTTRVKRAANKALAANGNGSGADTPASDGGASTAVCCDCRDVSDCACCTWEWWISVPRGQRWFDSWVCALTATILLMFTSITSATFSLLNCVQIDGVNRLFLYAPLQCFSGGQVFLLLLTVIFILPFPFALHFFRTRCARNRRIFRAAIEVLESPFTEECAHWESVLQFRRVVLVIVSVFTPEPFSRAFLLTLCSLAILYSSLYYRPFRDAASAHIETLFLSSLALIAMLSIRHGVIDSLSVAATSANGSRSQATTDDAINVLEVLCILLPLLVVAVAFVRSWVIRGRALCDCTKPSPSNAA